MTNSSFLGGKRAATSPLGNDVDALGPSDSSDSGSDVQGERNLQGEGEHADQLGSLIVDTSSDSDASGTGERASATGRDGPDGADIAPDKVIGPDGEIEVNSDDLLSAVNLLAQDEGLEPEPPAL
ncbi:hypothetical protein [Rhodoferax antarcticus]|uniref:hypothetical protein n=1 Tax=Rhodoferax antarcticus TaxID=81479 RepID=UPI00094F5A34|nr:hypothetical protein [Rhodoferax antarcticus]APW47972.1 hypothetical protein RA876_18285 [Rhodoferax antarcticus]MCW2313255.1 hypothetical protein [Rhodoferax antarcticus]